MGWSNLWSPPPAATAARAGIKSGLYGHKKAFLDLKLRMTLAFIFAMTGKFPRA